MQITNGMVRVEDGLRKNEEYAPPRKVAVELSFAVEEGNDPQKALDHVAQIANQQVRHLLGQSVSPVLASPAPAAPVSSPQAQEPKAAKKAAAEKPKAPEKTKADLEAEMGLTPGGPVETVKKAQAEDELGDMLSEPAKVAVTDKEISDACIGKADHMKTVAGWEPKKIRLLVEEFAGHTGAKFAQVPADKRHEFLKRLQELK